MTNFIRDNTALWTDKVEVNPVAVENQEWGAADIALTKQALLDTQSYLRSGIFDASPTVTLLAVNATSVAAASVNATAGTLGALDIVNNASASVVPTMDYLGFSGRWLAGMDSANNPTSRDYVPVALKADYSFNDGVTTSGSPTVTSASEGGFKTAMIGAALSGPGIPVGASVAAVGSATSLTMTANATATATGVRVTVTTGQTLDLEYWRHRGALSPTCGIGVTPPDGQARLQVSAQDDEPTMGTLRLRCGPSQTAKVLTLHDSAPIDRLWVDSTFWVSGNHASGGALLVQADATNKRALVMSQDKATLYGFEFLSASLIAFKCTSSGSASFNVNTNGGLQHTGATLGFFSQAPTTKPTVTGSRGGNAALASLLTALAALGLITDSTTA